MNFEFILLNNWKSYLQESFLKINEQLATPMNYGRLVRKIIYFHVCIMSYDTDIDKYVYFVKPSLIRKYWKIFEDDLTFEEEIPKPKLKTIQSILIENVESHRSKIDDDHSKPSQLIKSKTFDGFRLKYKSSTYDITTERWKKLKSNYQGDNFDEDVLILMLRYDIFVRNKEGIDLSVDNIYTFIKDNTKDLNVLEAFAGAINNNMANYCSLFYDIEKDFGSLGSFFKFKSLDEYDLIIANPPYITSIMDNMSIVLIQYLSRKSSAHSRLAN